MGFDESKYGVCPIRKLRFVLASLSADQSLAL